MRRSIMSEYNGMFFPLKNGERIFEVHPNILKVTNGNTVQMEIVQGVGTDIGVFIYDLDHNTNDSNAAPDNVANAPYLFTIKAGDTISWKVTPIDVHYANAATGTKTLWIGIRNASSFSINLLGTDIALNELLNHGVYTGSYTAETDFPMHGISGGIHHYRTNAAGATLKIELFYNGIQIC